MKKGYVLASDLGSGSCKTVIVDARGEEVAGAGAEYPTLHPHPGWVEQNPDDWYRCFARTARQAITEAGIEAGQIAMVGLVGVTHNTVLLDDHDRPLRNAILTFDQRSVAQCREIEARWGDRVFSETLNAVTPLWSWPQLLWIKQNEAETWRAVRRLLFQKDYVRHRLAPGFITDTIDAAGTLLYDPVARRWLPDFYEDLGLTAAALPELAAPLDIVSHVSRQGSLDTGLPEGTPVIAGTSDTAAEVFGSGLLRPGQGMVKLASVGRLAVVNGKPLPDPHILNYRHVLEGLWYPGSGTKSAATIPRWLRDNLWKGADYAELDREAAAVPPGSEGLLFQPHLHGEWIPHWDEMLRANFIGATIRHGRGHFGRAALEGVAFSIREGIEALASVGLQYREYRLIGGGAKSRLWRRIMCDCLGRQLAVPLNQDAAYGAALITGSASGLIDPAPEALETLIRLEEVIDPDARTHELYSELFAVYKEADRALVDTAHRLHRLAGRSVESASAS
jgi:xylulokinase